ncbi:MAG TPA: phosphoglucosamine mutase [Pyrinomonadaceae bacterium]|nr:phosphoglucosamine mutase [Pyrinomonadaceae bacterium]
MKALFGTDGIRGEAGRFPLDAATVKIIGFSLASHLAETIKEPAIVIGRDTRESGEWLEQALIEGATHAGLKCLSAGVITTPGVAYLTRHLKANAGVVISASHNPYQDNGIKIFSASGQKIDDALERQIERDVEKGFQNIDSKNPLSKASTSLRYDYLNFLTNEIANDLSLHGLSIVVDCANGASTEFAPKLFETLGARVIAINDKPDGRNINLNSGSLHIESLMEAVAKENADLGVAFDGDADRSLFVDEKGGFVDGDATLWVLANHLRSHGQLKDDTVVATVMSNVGLEIAFRAVGIKLIRTDVGDKYVLDELLSRRASLGGEQSGHIIMPALSLAGDGMITALCLLRALRESGQPLTAATAGFQQYPQVLVNVRVREKVPLDQIPAVDAAVRSVEERLSHKGRLLLRYSGTEALARVMIEGENQFDIEDYANRIADAIKQEIGA